MTAKRILPLILSAAVLTGAVIASSAVPKNAEKKAETRDSAVKEQQNGEEMRGVWVSFMDLSMENEADKSEKSFTSKFSKIADNCKKLGFNTIIAQVRPFCDALYYSEYFPHSHILTGSQGKDPGYDALEIMCRICREKKLKIHAWVNPYRVKTESTPKELSEDNPSKGIEIKTESVTILDPSNEAARKLIVDGVREIAEGYDIDGIQFDDYFYPEDIGNLDDEQYESYLSSGGGSMSLEEWRKFNVNMLVAEAYIAIHGSGKSIAFGISPQGNLENNGKLCADVESWCQINGYIDYICPQIYFSPDNPAKGFKDSLDEWLSLDYADGVKLYIGLAGYKAGTDNDEGTWENSDDILSREYELTKDGADGIMLFSYNSIISDNSKKEIRNLSDSFT